MSSLAAAQADGYYLPPEYFESGAYRKQSKNQFAASQQRRLFSSTSSSSTTSTTDGTKRQRGHNQWLQDGIVRFELPYKGICDKCCQSVGRGTRYNARKLSVGRYYSTFIYQFEMQCRLCQHPWIIRTNPKEYGFEYVKGVKLQAGQESYLAQNHQQQHPYATDDFGRDGNDDDENGIIRLETAVQGKHRALTELEELQRIRKLKQLSTLNDADNNASIRQSFRKDRKEKRSRLEEGVKKGWRNGLEVLPLTLDDKITANDVVYGRPKEEEKHRLLSVRKSSIFSSSRKTSTTPKRSNKKVANGTNLQECLQRRRSHQKRELSTLPTPVGSISIPSGQSVHSNPIVADVVTSSCNTDLTASATVRKVKRKLGTLNGPSATVDTMKSEASTIHCSTKHDDSPVEKVQDKARYKSPVAPPLSSSSFIDMMAAYESDEE
jgi:coiled-coil domain-containing protein 130